MNASTIKIYMLDIFCVWAVWDDDINMKDNMSRASQFEVWELVYQHQDDHHQQHHWYEGAWSRVDSLTSQGHLSQV